MRRIILVMALAVPLAAAGMAEPERDFLNAAMSGGLSQMLYGRLGVLRAEDGRVADFARHLLKEHAATNRMLIELAGAEGLPPAQVASGAAERQVEALRAVQPHGFDAAWLEVVVAEHRRLAMLYADYAAHGEDPELRDFALAHLPAIRATLEAARLIAAGGDISASPQGGD